jgi:hypothetical protein
MHNLLHWGGKLNWTPIVCLGAAAALVFVARILTVWFYLRRLNKAGELFPSQRPVVPVAVSNLYFLSGAAFIGVTVWGLVSTAWWMVLLGILTWFIIHWPFHEAMLSWSQFQNASLAMRDVDALSKGGLAPEQEEAIKRRLGLHRFQQPSPKKDDLNE